MHPDEYDDTAAFPWAVLVVAGVVGTIAACLGLIAYLTLG